MSLHSDTAFSRSSTSTTTTTTPTTPNHLLSLSNFDDSPWQINNSCSNGYNRSCYGNDNSGTHCYSSTLFAELLHSHDGPRSNGMEHNHNSESPLSSECSIIIEGMNRACPYSPEEKKIRIERYRSKRNQRNFNKKIKYVCRKTLADSRPRIRGRFAKNEEIGKNPTAQWSHIGGGEEEEEEDENWVSIFDSLVAANIVHESQANSSFGLLY